MFKQSLLAVLVVLALNASAVVVLSGCCTCGTVDPECSALTPSSASVCVVNASACNAALCAQILPSVEDAPFSFGASGCTPLGTGPNYVVTNLGICPVSCSLNSTCIALPSLDDCMESGGMINDCDWGVHPRAEHRGIPWLFVFLLPALMLLCFVFIVVCLRMLFGRGRNGYRQLINS